MVPVGASMKLKCEFLVSSLHAPSSSSNFLGSSIPNLYQAFSFLTSSWFCNDWYLISTIVDIKSKTVKIILMLMTNVTRVIWHDFWHDLGSWYCTLVCATIPPLPCMHTSLQFPTSSNLFPYILVLKPNSLAGCDAPSWSQSIPLI